MNNVWILILILTTGYVGGGVEINTIEFNNRESCESALIAAENLSAYARKLVGTCVEGGK